MDFFDWENAVTSDAGDLSELLASITPLDLPASPPPHSHQSISDADLLGLSLPQHCHSQDSVVGLDRNVDERFLDWPSTQQVELEENAGYNVSHVDSHHISLVPSELRPTPESLQFTQPNANLLGLKTTRPRKNSGTGAKLSLSAIKVLKEWVQDHARHPYPTELEREELRVMTGLRKEQISNWLANARRRGKVPPAAGSLSSNSVRSKDPGPHTTSNPVNIPLWGDDQQESTLHPLDRWRNSPPEDEPASVSAITNAMASTDSVDNLALPGFTGSRTCLNESDSNVYAGYRALSVSSLDTGGSSGSDWSHSQSSNQSHDSTLSRSSQHRQSRRRRKTGVKQNKSVGNVLPLDQPRMEEVPVLFVASSTPLLTISRHITIALVPNSQSTYIPFFAKITSASIYAYFTISVIITLLLWTAGWPERVEHLSVHFKKGTTMKDWKGDHGFEPRIEDIVENAVPPYMIQFEKTTPDPFSAESDSHRRTAILNSDSTIHWTSASQCGYLDLQKQLDSYIKEQIARDHVPTDHEIRDHARVLVFGGDDTWNQTRADIPEWLEHFKLRAGLISLPAIPGRNAYVGRDKASSGS
ncbi:hypothetical protein MMC26_004983 [Xylographa opegraphella]|nr:hypothetical protein [Xylographa opegraphella]